MKKLFVVKGKEYAAVHTKDNECICKVYYDGFNNSKLTEQEAISYAELFAKAPRMLQSIKEVISDLSALKQ